MKTGPTRRVGAGASALTRSGLVAVVGYAFLGSSFTSSSRVGSCMDVSPSQGVCSVPVLLTREQYQCASSHLDTQGVGEVDVSRGGSHIHHVIARGDLPSVRVDVPVGQWTRGGIGVQRHGNLPTLTRLQFNLGPAYQPFGWFSCACRQAKVDLGNLSTCT